MILYRVFWLRETCVISRLSLCFISFLRPIPHPEPSPSLSSNPCSMHSRPRRPATNRSKSASTTSKCNSIRSTSRYRSNEYVKWGPIEKPESHSTGRVIPSRIYVTNGFSIEQNILCEKSPMFPPRFKNETKNSDSPPPYLFGSLLFRCGRLPRQRTTSATMSSTYPT